MVWQEGRGLAGLRRDLGEDANVADEHDDRRDEEDDEVDEGEVGLPVTDWSTTKDRLADSLVGDVVDAVDAELWNGHETSYDPTDRSHRHRLPPTTTTTLADANVMAALPNVGGALCES